MKQITQFFLGGESPTLVDGIKGTSFLIITIHIFN